MLKTLWQIKINIRLFKINKHTIRAFRKDMRWTGWEGEIFLPLAGNEFLLCDFRILPQYKWDLLFWDLMQHRLFIGYSIPCECGQVYITQTDQSIKTRVKEHHHIPDPYSQTNQQWWNIDSTSHHIKLQSHQNPLNQIWLHGPASIRWVQSMMHNIPEEQRTNFNWPCHTTH